MGIFIPDICHFSDLGFSSREIRDFLRYELFYPGNFDNLDMGILSRGLRISQIWGFYLGDRGFFESKDFYAKYRGFSRSCVFPRIFSDLEIFDKLSLVLEVLKEFDVTVRPDCICGCFFVTKNSLGLAGRRVSDRSPYLSYRLLPLC